MEEVMAKYSEIAANVRAGAFDTGRRLVKVEEELLDSFEDYQGTVAKEVAAPWAAMKTTYSFAKQLIGLQGDLALEWSNSFARSAQQNARKASKATAAA
jgi:hypothetical protein